MELTIGEFLEVCKYHYIDLECLPDIIRTYRESIRQNNISVNKVYIGVIPTISYPPSAMLAIQIDTPDEVLQKVGYYDITDEIVRVVH